MPGGCALRLRCVLRVLRPEAEFEIWVSSSFRRDDDEHTSFLCHLPTLLGSNNRDLRPQTHMFLMVYAAFKGHISNQVFSFAYVYFEIGMSA